MHKSGCGAAAHRINVRQVAAPLPAPTGGQLSGVRSILASQAVSGDLKRNAPISRRGLFHKPSEPAGDVAAAWPAEVHGALGPRDCLCERRPHCGTGPGNGTGAG